MSKRNLVYRPPDLYSDDEDDYDGYYFNDEFEHKKTKEVAQSYWQREADDPELQLLDALESNDLPALKKHMFALNFQVNKFLVKRHNTLLNHACSLAQVQMVRYLLYELKADANLQVDSITPLHSACNCSNQKSKQVSEIVTMLLEHGAVINVSDKYSMTPLMLACKNAHLAVVRQLIKEASLDSMDHYGCTPIFFAVQANQPEILQMLLQAGADATIANIKGYTPVQVAQFHGFYDLLQFLPQPKVDYIVPASFLSYQTLQDHIPRLFLKPDCPEYFQDVYKILRIIGMEDYAEFFAKHCISLAEFLCMNDERLQLIGIKCSIHRQKILKGQLDFHLHHCSMKSIDTGKNTKDFYEFLMFAANHLQNLIVIKSSLDFVKQQMQQNKFGQISEQTLQQMKQNLQEYRKNTSQLKQNVKRLKAYLPEKNPLFIDYDEFLAERKRRRIKRYMRFTSLVIGISIFICLKMKKIF